MTASCVACITDDEGITVVYKGVSVDIPAPSVIGGQTSVTQYIKGSPVTISFYDRNTESAGQDLVIIMDGDSKIEYWTETRRSMKCSEFEISVG